MKNTKYVRAGKMQIGFVVIFKIVCCIELGMFVLLSGYLNCVLISFCFRESGRLKTAIQEGRGKGTGHRTEGACIAASTPKLCFIISFSFFCISESGRFENHKIRGWKTRS